MVDIIAEVYGVVAAPAVVLPESLPGIYRLTGIEHKPNGRATTCIAQLYHEKASLRVTWECRQPDTRLYEGALVSPRWLGRFTCSEHGAVRISRLVLLEIPQAGASLFDTVPHGWVRDRALVARAKVLTDRLPRHMALLFNALFWDGRRFMRFVVGPSSLNGHHNGRNGNLLHTVEVAETALKLAENRNGVCLDVLLMAALLHDSGKADEYAFNYRRGTFEISDRGALIGHKLTVLEWIAAAMAKNRILMPETHYLGLVHALTSAKGTPDWVGVRESRSLEAMLLSTADRLSGQQDLVDQLAPAHDGFGRYHPHLRGRPYVVGNASA